MSTRAVQFLKRHNICFDLVKYDHEQKGAEFAALATGFPLEQTIKTLVVDLEDRRYCLALVPGNRQLNVKLLAALFGVKRAAMTDTLTAERMTGYTVGGISPFGTKHKMPVVLDDRVRRFDAVMINAGQRGMMLKMSPEDIAKVLNCHLAAIGRD